MKTSFPKSKISVLLLESVHPAGVAALEAEGFQVQALPGAPDEAKLCRLVENVHLLGLRSKTEVTPRVLDAAPKLLAVGCFCIGTNQVALRDACRRGVPVFNSPFSNTRSVAELTIAEIIALYRRLTEKSDLMHRGVWDKSAAGAHEVRGRTLGIVGYGHIGSQVSVLAEALGMRVLYHDIIAKMPLGNARQVKSLADLLKESDVVTLHVPATRQTEGLIAAPQLKRMKPGAYLINNARGGVVDITALAAALTSGHLAGAALDVFPVEPSAKGESFESPLRGLANVILTPHVGGSTEEAQASIAEDVASKFIKFINVGTTTGAVNVPEVELPEQTSASTGFPASGTSALRAGSGSGPDASALRAGSGSGPDISARRAGSGSGPDASALRAGSGSGPATHARRAGSESPAFTRPHRILHFHRNVPGVLSKMHAMIADLGANISAEYLRTTDDIGYVVLDVDPTDGKQVLARLRDIPETIRVRMLW